MTDEQLKKEKYRCEMQSGTEGLTLADLFIKTAIANVYRPVRMHLGEYLPVDLVDFGDLKKSRLAGSLLKCIQRGWISVENLSEQVEVTKFSAPKMVMPRPEEGLTEVKAGLIDIKDTTLPVAQVLQPKGIDPFPKDKEVPVKEVVSLKDARTANSFALTEKDINSSVELPSNYKEFKGLKYFQKLKAIKESGDKTLLKEIAENDSYPQLIHNAKTRLVEITNAEG